MAQPLWYLRHEGKILGPFPPPQVRELLNSGAITGEWEISLNERDWLPLAESGHFSDQEWQAEAADEQLTWREERQRARERRRDEDEETLFAHDPGIDEARRRALGRDQQRTEHLIEAENARRPSLWIGLLAVIAVAAVSLVVWWGQSDQPIQTSLSQAVNCAAPPAEGVNWSGCDKRALQAAGSTLRNAKLDRAHLDDARLAGAILEYASATGTSLRNTDLRGAKLAAADLSGADLSGADFSGANLRYAVLSGALLAGTRLDHAVWSDGHTCAAGSIGGCL